MIDAQDKNDGIASVAKFELTEMVGQLLPGGVPDLLGTAKYPKIAELIVQNGRKNMYGAIYLMVKWFCSSLNVVRNMNEDQMLEVASMLMDECGDFRMEDYLIMFTMGKRGQLSVKLMDRVDIQYISALLDEFWRIRHAAGRKKQMEIQDIPPVTKDAPQPTPEQLQEAKAKIDAMIGKMTKIAAEPISDEEYRRIRAEYHTGRMQANVRKSDSQGNEE